MNEAINEMNPATPRNVDIWLTKLSDVNDALRADYKQLLDAAETERLNRFQVTDARDQFLVARALLRTVLSRYADVPGRAWTFDLNSYGKPHVAAPEAGRGLKFNLSHTKGLVACAVSRDCELGIDVENIEREVDHMDLASHFFAGAEVAAMNRIPPSMRQQYFYSIWTLKEAYIKARGMGLSLPLDSFWFDLDEVVPSVQFGARCPDSPSAWQFVRFDPTLEHIMALAVAVPADQPIGVDLRWIVPLI